MAGFEDPGKLKNDKPMNRPAPIQGQQPQTSERTEDLCPKNWMEFDSMKGFNDPGKLINFEEMKFPDYSANLKLPSTAQKSPPT